MLLCVETAALTEHFCRVKDMVTSDAFGINQRMSKIGAVLSFHGEDREVVVHDFDLLVVLPVPHVPVSRETQGSYRGVTRCIWMAPGSTWYFR